MSVLPQLSGRECIRILQRAGYQIKRQEGSYVILRREKPFGQVVVPDHKQLDRGTLRAIIRQAGFGIEEFLRLLE